MSRPRKKKQRGTWLRLHPSPIAVALDGTVFASVGLYDGIVDAEAAIRTAVKHGGRVVIGVELGKGDVAKLKKWLDEASFECLAFVLGARPRRQRTKVAGTSRRS